MLSGPGGPIRALLTRLPRLGRSASRPAGRWRPRSLRRRLLAWSIGIFAITIGVLTGVSLLEEQRALERVEARQASIWLGHLVEMPEFRGSAAEAHERLTLLRAPLRNAGVALTMMAAGATEAESGELAALPLVLEDGAYELVYRVLPGGEGGLASRTVLVHVAWALLAVTALAVATLWIVETRLVRPLGTAAHQLQRMGAGGGWEARLCAADGELQPLWSAVRDLGPGLARQVEEWICRRAPGRRGPRGEGPQGGHRVAAARLSRHGLRAPGARAPRGRGQAPCPPPRSPPRRGPGRAQRGGAFTVRARTFWRIGAAAHAV